MEEEIEVEGQSYPVMLSVVNGYIDEFQLADHTFNIKDERRQFSSATLLHFVNKFRDREKEIMIGLLHRVNKFA